MAKKRHARIKITSLSLSLSLSQDARAWCAPPLVF